MNLGKEKAKPKTFGLAQDEGFKTALGKAQHYQKKYKTAEKIPDSELPVSIDFRNIDGYDFTNQVRNQAACGSCYTLAFVQALESRLKIKYGQSIPELSP